MNKVLTGIIAVMLMAMPLLAQDGWTVNEDAPNWEYTGLLTDDAGDTVSVAGAYGSAWDGEGKLWTSTMWAGIVVVDTNGNATDYSPITEVTIADTAYSTTYSTGAAALPDGDIIVAKGTMILKFDHQTGELLDYSDYLEAGVAKPDIDADGYLYTPSVVGVNPITVFDSDLNFVQEIEVEDPPGVTRGIAVSDDGYTIYVGHGTRKGTVKIYSSEDLISYSLTDSIFANTDGDTIFFNQPLTVDLNKADGTLWVSNDNYYGGGGGAAIVENSVLNFNFDTREYYEVMMPDTAEVHKPGWYYHGPRGAYIHADNQNRMYTPSSNMGWVYVYDKTTTGINDNPQTALPAGPSLHQNYPNPFNPTTVIPFELKKDSQVQLTVYNAIGQKVAELVDGQMNAGAHQVTFDGSELSTGVYFYRLQANGVDETREMILVK